MDVTNQGQNLHITLYSFGFKHGHPEADMVWDVRFLPNPYWVPELKEYTGLDQPVTSYVLDNDVGSSFIALLEPFVTFILEQHHAAKRESIRFAVGCTGGKHRSVAVTEHLRIFLGNTPYTLEVFHRDIDKE